MVLFTGAPGTGKSTLADAAASRVAGSVLAWDWIMAGLTGFGGVQDALRRMSREDYRAVGWSIMWNLSIAQLRSGRAVVLDGVARDSEVGRFREIAADFGVQSVVVWTFCSDREIHRSRVEGRVRAIPGWHELDWSHVDALRTSLSEPADVDLRLDAMRDLEANTRELADVLTA